MPAITITPALKDPIEEARTRYVAFLRGELRLLPPTHHLADEYRDQLAELTLEVPPAGAES
jgi:hypothetical protein